MQVYLTESDDTKNSQEWWRISSSVCRSRETWSFFSRFYSFPDSKSSLRMSQIKWRLCIRLQ